ncbi:hypothetical protein SDC9_86379 [bioreactor metagenome]|uniref:Uncharacterized protein n=1 Tax=bioreactor metagenome TaxID=1076179 RepID=A0A644ZFT2_9ZZZZ
MSFTVALFPFLNNVALFTSVLNMLTQSEPDTVTGPLRVFPDITTKSMFPFIFETFTMSPTLMFETAFETVVLVPSTYTVVPEFSPNAKVYPPSVATIMSFSRAA